MTNLPEPWLRGPLPDVSPLIAPVIHSFRQVREDLECHTRHLTSDLVWSRPYGLTPLGFHLRHIAGSLDRLTSYLQGAELTEAQFADLANEGQPGFSIDELLGAVFAALDCAEGAMRAVDPARLGEARFVGRRRLPTTTIGLVIHIAEHTQRHLGQAISAAKVSNAIHLAVRSAD